MHYTRIIWGIIFVLQVTTRHYKLILIQTVGKLFDSILSIGFLSTSVSIFLLVTGVILLLDQFLKFYKRNPGHILSVPKSARPGSSRGGGG